MAKKRRRKIRYDRLLILLSIPISIIICIFLLIHNRYNIFLMFKGYEKEDRIILLRQSKEDIKEYVHSDVIDLSVWERYNNDEHFYDYELFQSYDEERSVKEVITYVDNFYVNYETLIELGYTREWLRDKMKTYTLEDFNVFVSNKITFEKADKYLSVHGCIVQDIPKYIKSSLSPKDAILGKTYPFINSKNKAKHTYEINNPEDLLVLIKKGFTLSEDYEPKDLVKITVARDKDYDSNDQLRSEAETALEEMFAAAKEKNLHLVVRSAYRSYEQQLEVYNHYMQMYEYSYAITLVAVPGCSEHQLGLGVDITSQSVIDGKYETFGYTKEYEWLEKHCYDYGYILRYPYDAMEMTGSTNEPWHFRYVGKEAAKEIQKNHWTLEEYILEHGFTYDLTLVE